MFLQRKASEDMISGAFCVTGCAGNIPTALPENVFSDMLSLMNGSSVFAIEKKCSYYTMDIYY